MFANIYYFILGIYMGQPIEDDNNSISPQIKAQFSSFIEPFFSQYHRDRCYPGLIFQ
ncbi:hypothetical protein [Nostoc sp. DedQUE12b]|uniref:hypothetical protein n=1 Tax=Nostoc sp. DedQUE12b TaxID=3075398 RepID=UPI002AD28315|nr:hypothetical protein [Nostoc sp. DedQUE12b]